MAGLFVLLVLAFGIGLWGSIVRPPAYEVRGVLIERPTPGLILVRHDAVAALGMGAMDLMAIVGDPAKIDAAAVRPGDPVRLAVKQTDRELTLLRIERAP
jgi:Cu/Ag efflux protein CusF